MAVVWRVLEILLMIDDDNRQAMRTWRTLVALALIAMFVHTLGADGYLKFAGVDGFASSKDIERINSMLDSAASHTKKIEDSLLEKAIIDLRSKQCAANSKIYFTERLGELMDQYYEVNKRAFQLPSCEDLK